MSRRLKTPPQITAYERVLSTSVVVEVALSIDAAQCFHKVGSSCLSRSFRQSVTESSALELGWRACSRCLPAQAT